MRSHPENVATFQVLFRLSFEGGPPAELAREWVLQAFQSEGQKSKDNQDKLFTWFEPGVPSTSFGHLLVSLLDKIRASGRPGAFVRQ